MGAAWRNVKDGPEFDQVLEMVRTINKLDMEVCCTLGMITENQAHRLAEAGLYAYNHNLDTSREFYPEIVTTRTYDERLKTLANVRAAGINVCSGGILGLGEKEHDRVGLLYTLATLESHPESVPINSLVLVAGTPLGDKGKENELGASPPTATEMTRMIATARIVMPKTIVRLSAGRKSYSMSEQALMFMAGANSIFYGEQLLTTPNPQVQMDNELFKQLGLKGKEPFSPIGASMVERVDNMSMDTMTVRIDHSRIRATM
jgi:biotin synthase